MKFRYALGEVLRELRVEKKLTLRQLSFKAGVSLGYLSEVERGSKEVSSEILNSISKAIQIPLHQIIIEAGHRIQMSSLDTYESVERELTVAIYK
jgi:transcriptional regulator with XRE-family HTH domain